MNFYFKICYYTVYGEELILNIVESCSDFNKHLFSEQIKMKTDDGCVWYSLLNLPEYDKESFMYFYSVRRDGEIIRKEWSFLKHYIFIDKSINSYFQYDKWNDSNFNAYLYTTAFTKCLNCREKTKIKKQTKEDSLQLKVKAPQVPSGYNLLITGQREILGAWNPDRALVMEEFADNEWLINLNPKVFYDRKIEFKFIIRSYDNEIFWETSSNRIINIPFIKESTLISYELDEAHFDLPLKKFAGTLIPLFSLKTNNSFGVGDFGDLKKFIDLMVITKQSVIQLLPINDTTASHTWEDSYPYNCISIYALHPQYVNLRDLPSIKRTIHRERFDYLQQELNSLKYLDYERVNRAKNEYLQILFEQEGNKYLKSSSFISFFKKSAQWLVPYAVYSYFRDYYGTCHFNEWKDYRIWKEKYREIYSDKNTEEYKRVSFYYFVQFILYQQMLDAHHYARKKGIVLKGDIPIGVSRYGCDVWSYTGYFNLNQQAGAPPDNFSKNGQNWGFPTYNWDKIIKEQCKWWKNRIQHMSIFFDAFRIDHVLGFFRIWEIPINSVQGILGQFSPSIGFTKKEIEERGLVFDEEKYISPYIKTWMIDKIFGKYNKEVKDIYLTHIGNGVYKLQSLYDTQQKVQEIFKNKTSSKDKIISDGLYTLINNVLFTRDHTQKNLFHPRIGGKNTPVYDTLSESDKVHFNILYDEYFYYRNEKRWENEALKKLPFIVGATKMLVCAEDLGMIPSCVSPVLKKMNILSLEIQSMPKESFVEFGCLKRNPYYSVSTISTHDMPTLREWWEENAEKAQIYYNKILYLQGNAPKILTEDLAQEIINLHLASNSMLCIISFQDWLSMDKHLRFPNSKDERINDPSNPKHYWRYRMHTTIENIMNNKSFVEKIKYMILRNNRA